MALRWAAVTILSGATLALSISLIWGDFDSTVGIWLEDTFVGHARTVRVNWGHRISGLAIVHDDGTYDFFTEEQWDEYEAALAIEQENQTAARDVLIYLSYRSRDQGWYGLATHIRPLHFSMNVWTTDGRAREVDEEVRKQLKMELLDQLCGGQLDCPYYEVLEKGSASSNEWVSTSDRTYYDSYVLRRLRLRGCMHNALTLIALLLLPIAVLRTKKSIGKYHDWKYLIRQSTCPSCGYDVRLLPEPRCPECGTLFAWKSQR